MHTLIVFYKSKMPDICILKTIQSLLGWIIPLIFLNISIDISIFTWLFFDFAIRQFICTSFWMKKSFGVSKRLQLSQENFVIFESILLDFWIGHWSTNIAPLRLTWQSLSVQWCEIQIMTGHLLSLDLKLDQFHNK